MKFTFRRFDLKLTHTWAIASNVASGGKQVYPASFVELRDSDGVVGTGESAPSSRYNENVDSACAFYSKVDASRLSFDDVDGSMAYLEALAPGNYSPKGALNIALLDGAAQKAGKPLYEMLGLAFAEGRHVTSFTIGLDSPEMMRRKVREADEYPILKIKVGSAADEQNLAAVRAEAPSKRLRVDANEGWKTKEEALRRLEWLARDANIEFVEQPMPAGTPPAEMKWLKERSPLPLFADESYLNASMVDLCAECFHGVNVKLCKTGGPSRGFEALRTARKAGLKTMLGCMIESSVLISAGAHLAELTDHLDLDGNILITNDPYAGVRTTRGIMSFEGVNPRIGLQVRPRENRPA
jgi:L-alanine-DL-glutamate epimerase-like enolase superfamily enzyme